MGVVKRGQDRCRSCVAFDRFAPSTSHVVATLEDFQVLGVDFDSCTQQIDKTTHASMLTFVLAAIAEFECVIIGSRSSRAWLQRRPETNLWEPNADPHVKAEQARSRRSQGALRQIANQLSVSPGTVLNDTKSTNRRWP